MKIIPYIGNGAYCYSNSIAMLLASIGENISPSKIEVLSGVGLGAFEKKDTNLTFFSNFSGLPDQGINKALDILGYKYKEGVKQKAEPAPFNELKGILTKGPAVLGPLDMGYLIYDPSVMCHHGVDHFVLVYGINNQEIFLHDPAGFPNVSLSKDKLKFAWKAESISYRRGYYRYWTAPRKIKNPTEDEIHKQALESFKKVYLIGERYAKKRNVLIDVDAVLSLANKINDQFLNPEDINLLTCFVFPLGARRATDFSLFFYNWADKLANLKNQQAQLFGLCHTLAVVKNWTKLSKTLIEFAKVEKEFKESILTTNESQSGIIF